MAAAVGLASIGLAALVYAQPGGQSNPRVPSLPNPFDEAPATTPSPTQPAPSTTPDPSAVPQSIPSLPDAAAPRTDVESSIPSLPGSTAPSTTPAEPSAPSGPQGRMPGPNPFATDSGSVPSGTPTQPSATEAAPDTSGGQESSAAEEEMKAGVEFLNQGKFADALPHFQEAAKLAPKDTAPYLFLGVTNRFMNRYDDAIDAFTRQIELDNFDAEGYLRRGIVWFYKGEYGIAWADFDEASILLFDDPQPELWKGLARARQGRWLDAVNSYAVALQHNDKFAPAWVNLGLAYLELNQPNKAVYCFDHAIRVEPRNAASYFKRGVALAQMGKMREAADSYSQAIRIQPNFAEAYFNRGLANREIGESQQAAKDRAEALRLNPNIDKQLTSAG